MKDEDVAVARYAHALFQAAYKARVSKKVSEDLQELVQVFDVSGLKRYIENPRIPMDRKVSVIRIPTCLIWRNASLRFLFKEFTHNSSNGLSFCQRTLFRFLIRVKNL